MPEVTYSLDRSSGMATFVIDTAGPVNTIGQQFLADLERATAQANRDGVKGVAIASAKKASFLDGANLKEILTDSTPQSVRLTVRRCQDALATLAKSPFPVVALLDGQTALGGGFELLLWACDHVFATTGSKFGLPEVNVGLFPAAGGTHTLPRVVGFASAVDTILSGRISPAEAYESTDLVTVCPTDELRSRAVNWLADNQGMVNRNYDPERKGADGVTVTDAEAEAIVAKARTRYALCPNRPYLLAAIDSLEAGRNKPAETAAGEDIGRFVSLLEHPNSRNKIDLFFLVTSVGPRLAKTSHQAGKIQRAAVVGSGLMGVGIAQVMAEKGLRTTLVDVDDVTTRRAVERIDRTLGDLVARGRWSESRKERVMANIDCTTDYSRLRDVPLFIECVFEDLSLKKKILSQVQAVCPDAIFASNTSTIPIGDITQSAAFPGQAVGMHFFSPVPLMPLLEVIEGPASTPAALATAVSVGRAIGKTVIVVGDGPGFYTSRTFGRYVMNGFRLAELGVSPWDVDRLALKVGFPQGPLHVYGTAGGNVVYHAGKFMAERLPERFEMPRSIVSMYEAGYVGAGQASFYADEKKMAPNESALDKIVLDRGVPRPTDQEVEDILLLGMVNEAFWCMSDGVLRDYYSMDLGAVLGIGFPDCWHGPARYVSQKGVRAVKARLAELADKFLVAGLAPAPEFDLLTTCGLDCQLI
ncbi:MAG: enoyl-CoA hydratase/isomerase family protein [Desulfomonile tiedjei]|nr:enoyl-CoA hydratase/isomerase family protein [Desulfomonile tiedjei]